VTQLGIAAQDAVTGPPRLEGRNLTKHFPVHGQLPGQAAMKAGNRFRGRQVRTSSTAGRFVHAVEDISLALPAAQVTALVGESGSGKSTLARVFARLLRPTSGQLLLDGSPVPSRGRDRREYARQVQMVLQDPFSSLNAVHDVRYHLARPLLVHRLLPHGSSLDDAVTGLLERVALTPADQFIRKYPHELSGGQRQRVAIARALAVQPRVLLADEPVSMLDVSIRLGILNLLRDLCDSERLAILYITHDIASARYLADTIAVMYAGQMVETGPAQAVTDQPAHPYTQLLLSAAPDPHREGTVAVSTVHGSPVPGGAATTLPARRGAPPSLVAPPQGCRFHPRCPHAMAICAQTSPPGFETAAGHASACWLHATDLDAAQAAPLSPVTSPGPADSNRQPAPTPRREESGA
jgi:peptide/nickel transport system ATP-binding protein